MYSTLYGVASSSYLSILHCIHLLLLLLPLLLLPPLTLLLTPQLLTLLLQYSHFYYIQVILLVQQIRRHPDPALRRLGGSHRHGSTWCTVSTVYSTGLICTVLCVLYLLPCTSIYCTLLHALLVLQRVRIFLSSYFNPAALHSLYCCCRCSPHPSTTPTRRPGPWWCPRPETSSRPPTSRSSTAPGRTRSTQLSSAALRLVR